MACAALITQSTGTPTLEEWAKLDLNAPNSCVLRLMRVQLDDNNQPRGVEEVVCRSNVSLVSPQMVVTFQTSSS